MARPNPFRTPIILTCKTSKECPQGIKKDMVATCVNCVFGNGELVDLSNKTLAIINKETEKKKVIKKVSNKD